MSELSRRKELECLAINPETGKCDLVLYLSYEKIQTILKYRRTPGDVFTIKNTVLETLQHPSNIYKGIRFEEDEKHSCNAQGWLCYCSRPAFRYSSNGSKIPAPVDKIFLVFVNVDCIIYHWTWEKADIDSLATRQPRPINYETRFNKSVF
ncbi:MAG: hypothetical protein LBE12_01450 [Planctomycetaceae bacterium]|jgi:hypothetical protein|nr:hypothetical protein [Planctomycetaceae bacterium]